MNASNKQAIQQGSEPGIELELIQLSLNTQSTLSDLSLSDCQTECQTLSIKLTKPQALIEPAALAQTALPEELDSTQPIVLFGQAPIWLYSRLISQCQSFSSDIPWIGTYDARGQRVVVVASSIDAIAVGDELAVALNRTLCPAILIGGPPNSGKSVFSNALRVAIKQKHPDKRVYLHRASWDGEGNWVYEAGSSELQPDGNRSSQRDLINRLVSLNEFRIHEDPETAKLIPGYFQYHASAVKNLRQLADLLIVDVGGLPQVEKRPLVEQCSHYIVISRLPEAIDAWHQLCGLDLSTLAVVHSVLESCQTIVKRDPIEVTAGPWVASESAVMPQILLDRIDCLFSE